MKLRAWVAFQIVCIGILGCGKGASPEPEAVVVEPVSHVRPVVGNAGFGNYCHLGSYMPPQPVPLTLWECPINVNTVELAESLQPFNLQADCKKKLLDVRSPTRAFEPVSWEIMPDGNFYFSMDGGKAKLKDDGAGNLNCTTPLRADMWGRVDCTNRDKPIIRVETVWWIGQTLDHGGPIGSPSVIPSGGPSGGPSGSPSVVPSPSSLPFPQPSRTFVPAPFPVPTPIPSRNALPVPAPSSSGGVLPAGACKLPSGCYFHNVTRIDQCT